MPTESHQHQMGLVQWSYAGLGTLGGILVGVIVDRLFPGKWDAIVAAGVVFILQALVWWRYLRPKPITFKADPWDPKKGFFGRADDLLPPRSVTPAAVVIEPDIKTGSRRQQIVTERVEHFPLTQTANPSTLPYVGRSLPANYETVITRTVIDKLSRPDNSEIRERWQRLADDFGRCSAVIAIEVRRDSTGNRLPPDVLGDATEPEFQEFLALCRLAGQLLKVSRHAHRATRILSTDPLLHWLFLLVQFEHRRDTNEDVWIILNASLVSRKACLDCLRFELGH